MADNKPAVRKRSSVSRAGAILSALVAIELAACGVNEPGIIETKVANGLKEVTIGGEDWKNPLPNTEESAATGAEHFRHHCQVCHGLDGHGTGVPFASRMSPPVPDLGAAEIQEYADGQLKWIIENGIGFTGMPGWKGILDDEEMWAIVHYMRNLPEAGSLGAPDVYAGGGHNETPAGDGHTHDHEENSQ